MEHTSIGGIFNIAGNKNTTCEQIDEAKKNQSSDGESTFNRMEDDLFARSFPSLMVVVRPSIRDKYIRSQVAHTERRALDDKVKNMLGFSAAKFTEWLFEQGLVKSRQYCSHHSTKSEKVNLKYVSVFSGSVFQEAPYMPTVLLKLIYHWACQTDVQNVISWVNVSNIYLQNFYANLRSICTAAVWDKSRKMGGKNSEIQVGVIKLRTMLTMPSGHTRQVQIEVLAVLDPVTSDIRLRACDPMQGGDRLVRRRFHNILRPLKEWVHTDSKIMTDFTVDKRALNDLGYNHVVQSAFAGQNSKNMNNFHMEFLRKSVWAMFQKTMLSLLGRHMIQQFLDELIWRETYGGTSKRAFDNIIRHIAEQTKFDLNNNLINRLAKIASNPFHDWSYTMTHSAGDMLASSKADHH
ncbi:hypothetical protein X777_08748 [Ooceraea biroi]|uniref:Uncharacterized protein n=1 Tax=Ooceraea biroi TaxID=2015173 RepID=A0A026W8G8_OOCBI|nr:hypothetical protein X777_08748 [Ooceraea biroi]